MVADPGGAPFYIMTPTPPPGGGTSTSFSAAPNPGRCGWNELMAADATREISFYTGQFGWTLPDPMDMGPMGQYQFIEHDGVQVGAIMGTMPEMPHPMWNHYFWVDSIAAAKELIEAQGGQVINGVFVKRLDANTIEVRNQTFGRIIIRVDRIDAIALS